MACWTLRLLGPFLAEREGQALSGFRSDKVRALLAYLAVRVDRPWSRATLADLLWPEQPEAAARSNLRNALSNLRRVLGDARSDPPFLRLDGDVVAANGAAARWVDVDAFLGARCGVGGDALSETDPGTIARLEDALALYRGDFLEGFLIDSAPFEGWLAATREQLRLEATCIARVIAFGHARAGDVTAATVATRSWLGLDAWEEEAHRHLMRLLVIQGQRGAALDHFEAYRRDLAEELGVEPEAETVRQAQAIQTGDALVLTDDVAVAAWPGLRAQATDLRRRAPFVAREQALSTLAATLRRASSGQASVAFVTGEPGSGKTALATEFARRALAHDPRLRVVWGACSGFTGRGDPFEPFRHVAGILCGEAALEVSTSGESGARRLWQSLPATVTALLDHGPDLLDRLVAGRSLLAFARRHSGIDPEQLRRLQSLLEERSTQAARGPGPQPALLEQFTQVVRALAERGPIVIVLDDLQWIDAASLDLLFLLARRLGDRRVMLLGAYREEEAARRPSSGAPTLLDVVDELLTAEGSVRIDLTHADGPFFVDALVDSEPNALHPSFRSLVYQRTSGNPLFTIELLRGMQLRGELGRDAHGRWVEGPDLCWDDVPARVEAVIARRIEHLSPGCRDLLTVASVEGEQFTAEVAAAVAGRPPEEAYDLLGREAGRRHLLVNARTRMAVGDQSLSLYRFRHGLFQTYLRGRLDAVERARLHGAIGRELERIYRQDPGRYPPMALALARHFEAAGLTPQAVGAYADAARHAQTMSAHGEAVELLRRALGLLDTLPASESRDRQELELQLALGPPLTAGKGWAPPELAGAFARADELCAGIDDSVQLIPALWMLSVFRIGRSEHGAVQQLWERMARLARDANDRALIALTSLNVSPFYRGRFEEARRTLEAAAARPDLREQRQLAERFGMAPAVVALAYLAECLWLVGQPHEARARDREAHALAERVGHPMTTCYAIGRSCWSATLRGDDDATCDLAGRLLAVATPFGFVNFAHAATFFLHRAAVRRGGGTDDLAAMEGAITGYRASGTSLNHAAFLAHFAQGCAEVGEVGRGIAAVDASLGAAARSGELWFQAEAWRIKGVLLRARADGDEDPERTRRAARACLETAQHVARQQGATAIERRAAESLAVQASRPRLRT
jgi:DNA-binding SARP family transcriptional activator/tetratricopeptide (TPR) repeat protein